MKKKKKYGTRVVPLQVVLKKIYIYNVKVDTNDLP